MIPENIFLTKKKRQGLCLGKNREKSGFSCFWTRFGTLFLTQKPGSQKIIRFLGPKWLPFWVPKIQKTMVFGTKNPGFLIKITYFLVKMSRFFIKSYDFYNKNGYFFIKKHVFCNKNTTFFMKNIKNLCGFTPYFIPKVLLS